MRCIFLLASFKKFLFFCSLSIIYLCIDLFCFCLFLFCICSILCSMSFLKLCLGVCCEFWNILWMGPNIFLYSFSPPTATAFLGKYWLYFLCCIFHLCDLFYRWKPVCLLPFTHLTQLPPPPICSLYLWACYSVFDF